MSPGLGQENKDIPCSPRMAHLYLSHSDSTVFVTPIPQHANNNNLLAVVLCLS